MIQQLKYLSTWNPSLLSLKDAYYILGFSDGEGSFNISFKKRNDYKIGWKIVPVFNISQKEKEPLIYIQKHLNCGTLRYRKDGVWVDQVENFDSLQKHIIPFFSTYISISKIKRDSFNNWKEIILILKSIRESNSYLTLTQLKRILHLRNLLQTNFSRRTYTDEMIIQHFIKYVR